MWRVGWCSEVTVPVMHTAWHPASQTFAPRTHVQTAEASVQGSSHRGHDVGAVGFRRALGVNLPVRCGACTVIRGAQLAASGRVRVTRGAVEPMRCRRAGLSGFGGHDEAPLVRREQTKDCRRTKSREQCRLWARSGCTSILDSGRSTRQPRSRLSYQ